MIQEQIEDLKRLTQRYNDLSDKVKIDFKKEEGWSFGQILKHVMTVNETYFEVFDKLLAGSYKSPFLGRFSAIPNFVGNQILASQEPSNAKKVTTFPVWEPRDVNHVTILQDFEDHQALLIGYLKRLNESGLLKKNPVIRSPASNLVIYYLDMAIKIMIVHEKRHLKQAEELKN